MSQGNAHLGLLGRDDSVTGDELGHDATSSLNAERERADVDENDVTGPLLTREDTTLDSSTISHGLIGVDSLRGLLAAEVLLEELLDLGNTSGTTNEDNLQRIVHYQVEEA